MWKNGAKSGIICSAAGAWRRLPRVFFVQFFRRADNFCQQIKIIYYLLRRYIQRCPKSMFTFSPKATLTCVSFSAVRALTSLKWRISVFPFLRASPSQQKPARTETMYLRGGHSYVYLIYGMYSCMNITASVYGNPEAVLIRSVVPSSHPFATGERVFLDFG